MSVVTALAVSLWLSALCVKYRDVAVVIPFLLQVWLYVSPVAYPASVVPERWRLLYSLNPMAGVIEGFRWSLLGTASPDLRLMAVSGAVVVVLLVGGVDLLPSDRADLRGRRLMGDLAIRIDGLSKRYEIGAIQQRHDTLRDHIVHGLQSPGQSPHRGQCGANRVLGAEEHLPRRQARRSARPDRPERRRQEHAPQGAVANHGADDGTGRNLRTTGLAARGRAPDSTPS